MLDDAARRAAVAAVWAWYGRPCLRQDASDRRYWHWRLEHICGASGASRSVGAVQAVASTAMTVPAARRESAALAAGGRTVSVLAEPGV